MSTFNLVRKWRVNVQTQCRVPLQIKRGQLGMAFDTLRHWAEQCVANIVELQAGAGRAAGHLHGCCQNGR